MLCKVRSRGSGTARSVRLYWVLVQVDRQAIPTMLTVGPTGVGKDEDELGHRRHSDHVPGDKQVELNIINFNLVLVN